VAVSPQREHICANPLKSSDDRFDLIAIGSTHPFFMSSAESLYQFLAEYYINSGKHHGFMKSFGGNRWRRWN